MTIYSEKKKRVPKKERKENLLESSMTIEIGHKNRRDG